MPRNLPGLHEPRTPRRFRRWAWTACWAAALLGAAGCKSFNPSNARGWSPDQAVLAEAEFKKDKVTVKNIRAFKYKTPEDYAINYYDKTFDLDEVRTVDFLMCPFPGTPRLAHTMLSFGFEDETYVAVSVEIRKESGEGFSAAKGSLRQYELMYVVADERDVVQLRTNHRYEEVYLYHTKATPEQARAMFVDVMHRVNKLRYAPEFYDTMFNNCTTNIVQHVNHLQPNRVPLDLGVLLPGLSDKLAYDLGLIDTELSFEQARREAYITPLSQKYSDDDAYSTKIRRRTVAEAVARSEARVKMIR